MYNDKKMPKSKVKAKKKKGLMSVLGRGLARKAAKGVTGRTAKIRDIDKQVGEIYD